MSQRGARAWFRAVLLAVSLASPTLQAEHQHRVVVVDARDMDDAITLELLARVRGELGAAGFEVILLPVTGEVDPRVAVETLARDLAPAAVLSVRHTRGATPGESVAEMWVSDRLSSRTLMQRTTFDDRETSTQTARLAVQAAELLKARLALLWVDPAASTWTPLPARPEPQVEAPSPPLAPAAEPDGSSSQSQLSVGAGFGLLHNFKGGFGSAWAPLLRVGFASSALSNRMFALEFRVSGAMSPASSKLSFRPVGSAHVRQSFVLAEALGRFLPAASVQPVISLGNGVYTVSASGEADPPYSANSSRTWSGLSALGVGLWIQPSRSVAWIVEAQVLASWSKTSIALADHTIGSVGLPMGFVNTGVVVIF